MTINLEPSRLLLESQMQDRIHITRGLKTYTWNDVLKKDIEDISDIWTGPALISGQSTAGDDEAGGEERLKTYYNLFIPLSAPLVKPKDFASITAVRPNGNQLLVGRVIRIEETVSGTNSVSQRLSGYIYSEVPN